MKNLGLIILFAFLTGCSTITFVKSDKTSSRVLKTDQWHHIGIAGLVEFSEPVDLKKQCRRRNWQSITVEKGFLAGLIGGFTSNLYTPWNVEISCKKKYKKKRRKRRKKRSS